MKLHEIAAVNSTTAGRTAAAIAERALLGAVTFSVTILLGRWGGPQELGLFAVFFPVLFIAIALQESLVIVPYTVFLGEYSGGESRRRFLGSVIIHAGALGLIAAAGFAAAAAILTATGLEGYATVAAVLILAAPCALMREFARRIVYAERRPGAAVVISGGAGLLQIAAMAALYAAGHLTAASSFAAMGASGALTGACWWYFNRRAIEFRQARARRSFGRNWALGGWSLATQVSEIVRTQMFPWLLALAADERTVGVYAACAVVASLPTPLHVALSNMLLPELAHRRQRGAAAASGLMWQVAGWLTVVMTLFCLGVAALSNHLVPWLFGDRFDGFAGTSRTLILLALAQLLTSASLPAARALLVFQRPGQVFASHFAGIAVNVVLGIPMVHYWGLTGAAYATLFGAALKAALSFLWCSRAVRREIAREAPPPSADLNADSLRAASSPTQRRRAQRLPTAAIGVGASQEAP